MNQIPNMINLLHLSIKGHTFGIGHYTRQRNLAQFSQEKGWKSKLSTIDENDSLETIKTKLEFGVFNPHYILMDFDPRFVVTYKEFFIDALQNYKNKDYKVIVFESDKEFSITNFFKQFDFDLIIFPHGNLGVQRINRSILGFGLSVFSHEAERTREIRIARENYANEFLISCGGSDPFNISTIYVQSLEKLAPIGTRVCLVIGEFFDSAQINELKILAKSSRLNLRLVHRPNDISLLLLNSRIALTTGGLTRNEAIFLTVPSIIIDINPEQNRSTNLFALQGALLSAGLFDANNPQLTSFELERSLKIVLHKRELLSEISNNARLAIPENGARLILKELENQVEQG